VTNVTFFLEKNWHNDSVLSWIQIADARSLISAYCRWDWHEGNDQMSTEPFAASNLIPFSSRKSVDAAPANRAVVHRVEVITLKRDPAAEAVAMGRGCLRGIGWTLAIEGLFATAIFGIWLIAHILR
jgi:hypothetical protein